MFRDDPDNWDDRWFPCDRPGASTTRDTGSSAMSLGQTIKFLCGFPNKPNIRVIMDFEWRACKPRALICYLLVLSILWRQQARSQFHKDIVSSLELDETDFLFSFK